MKIPEKSKHKKEKVKKKPVIKLKKDKVLIVAQEIKFARLLSGNDKVTRDRVLKTLKKWLINCFSKGYDFKETDFIRIWKGLFYAVWMSDKPLIQEELCESIANILDHFPPDHIEHAVLMMKAGFHVLAKEWYGIDQHRMDKFLMLVRRYLRGGLRSLKRAEWSEHACKLYSNMMSSPDGIFAAEVPQYARNATSMILHVIDCFIEELSKVSSGCIPPTSLSHLLSPLCSLLVRSSSPALVSAARRCLSQLIRQSETGIEYSERTKAWERLGCPEGGPDALELDEASDDESEQGSDETNQDPALDPRAGRVNVILHPLPVPANEIARILTDLLKSANNKAQRRARIMIERFTLLSKSQYPYAIETPVLEANSVAESEVKAADNLRRLEKTLVASSDELALRGLKRKHRKRLLAKARAGLNIVDEVNQLCTKDKQESEWQVENMEPPAKKMKMKQNAIGKENIKKREKNKLKKNKKKLNIDNKSIEKHNDSQKQDKHDDSQKQRQNSVTQKQGDNGDEDVVCKRNVVTLNSDIKSKPAKQVIINSASVRDNKNIKKAKEQKVQQIRGKQTSKPNKNDDISYETPKKVKFVLKNNCMQGPVDYYKSVRQSPNIPYDGAKKPSKTNLKVSTPSPINPFFKKKMKLSKLK